MIIFKNLFIIFILLKFYEENLKKTIEKPTFFKNKKTEKKEKKNQKIYFEDSFLPVFYLYQKYATSKRNEFFLENFKL